MARQTRRTFIQTTAIAAGATIAAPYVKSARSAGTLALGMWDHWVPGANDVLAKMCQDWGQQNGSFVCVAMIGLPHLVSAACAWPERDA